jgi:hypothetical protein
MPMPARMGRSLMRRMRRRSLGSGMSRYAISFFYGKVLILACTGDCTQCDDGFTGTGICWGTTIDSVKGESTALLS